MMALESTYFSMAEKFLDRCNVLVICDRGAMDASAYVDPEQWRHLVDRLGVDEQNICEDRYDHVVHMVSEGGIYSTYGSS